MEQIVAATAHRAPWNKGKLVGQKVPFKLRDIWAIRVRLQFYGRIRDLALFDLAIDSKLRACDLVRLRVRDVSHGDRVGARAIVMQQKTRHPVQFEITEQSRQAIADWVRRAGLKSDDYLFPSRVHQCPHLSTRQYARIVDGWVREIGLDPGAYCTHTLRRTKASLIYRRPRTSEPFSCSSAIPNWRVPSATSASRWTTPLKWPNRRKSSSLALATASSRGGREAGQDRELRCVPQSGPSTRHSTPTRRS